MKVHHRYCSVLCYSFYQLFFLKPEPGIEGQFSLRKSYYVHTVGVEAGLYEDPKRFWNFVNSKRSNNSHPSSFTYNNEELTEPKQVADAFANHFKSVFSEPVSYPSTYNDVSSVHQSIFIGNITIDDVKEALKRMKPKRAVGPDGVPQYIYKACSEFLTTPLTYIFNLIISKSTFPHTWTISSVTPIPKKNKHK